MSEPLGLTTDQLEAVKTILMGPLVAKSHYQVFIFGSRRRGDFRKYSDLDFWIEAEPSLTLEELADLADSFQDSELPYQIDIVTPETCTETFKANIMAEKVIWFSKP